MGWNQDGTYDLNSTQALRWGYRAGVRSFTEAVERIIAAGIPVLARHPKYVVVRVNTTGVIWTALTGLRPDPERVAYHDEARKRALLKRRSPREDSC